MKVCDLMTEHVVSVGVSEPVSAAARLMKAHNVGALPVCDGRGRLRGIVTDRDLVTRCVALGGSPAEMKVGDVMSRGVLTAEPFEDIASAAGKLRSERVRRLPVVREGRLVGFLSLCDLARDLSCDMEAANALSEISKNVLNK